MNHLENPQGKNGIWSLDKDVSQLLKFEPKYKNHPERLQLEKEIETKISSELSKFNAYKIKDGDNKCFMYIVKNMVLPVLNEI